MKQDPYKLPFSEVLREIVVAAQDAGPNGSLTEAHFFVGVALALHEKKTPPFVVGDTLVCPGGARSRDGRSSYIPIGKECVIYRVWHLSGAWYLEFESKYRSKEGKVALYWPRAFVPLRPMSDAAATDTNRTA